MSPNRDGARPSEGEDLVVARPCGRWDEHLVPGTKEHEAAVEQRLFAAGGDHDVARRDARHTEPLVRTCRDDLAERLNPLHEGVSSRPGVERALRRLADECWRREIRLARTQVDYRTACRTKCLCPRGDCNRRGLLELGDVRRRRVMHGTS